MKYIRELLSIVLIISVTLLSCCQYNIENVEQRDYATMLMVSATEGNNYHYVLGIAKEHHVGDKGEAEEFFEASAQNLKQLALVYGELEGKELSLSHLKVILTGVNIDHEELVYELDNYDEVAKTCPVLMTQDVQSIMKYLYAAKEPVGTYISDLVKNANRDGKDIPKLLNYLKFYREGKGVSVFNIYVDGSHLRVKGEKP